MIVPHIGIYCNKNICLKVWKDNINGSTHLRMRREIFVSSRKKKPWDEKIPFSYRNFQSDTHIKSRNTTANLHKVCLSVCLSVRDAITLEPLLLFLWNFVERWSTISDKFLLMIFRDYPDLCDIFFFFKKRTTLCEQRSTVHTELLWTS